jgi:acetolactate synthase-1/2/3 large subunit
MMDAFGGYGEYVEKPAEIRPALERAFASGKAAIVNVKTDFRARATTMRFTDYST